MTITQAALAAVTAARHGDIASAVRVVDAAVVETLSSAPGESALLAYRQALVQSLASVGGMLSAFATHGFDVDAFLQKSGAALAALAQKVDES